MSVAPLMVEDPPAAASCQSMPPLVRVSTCPVVPLPAVNSFGYEIASSATLEVVICAFPTCDVWIAEAATLAPVMAPSLTPAVPRAALSQRLSVESHVSGIPSCGEDASTSCRSFSRVATPPPLEGALAAQVIPPLVCVSTCPTEPALTVLKCDRSMADPAIFGPVTPALASCAVPTAPLAMPPDDTFAAVHTPDSLTIASPLAALPGTLTPGMSSSEEIEDPDPVGAIQRSPPPLNASTFSSAGVFEVAIWSTPTESSASIVSVMLFGPMEMVGGSTQVMSPLASEASSWPAPPFPLTRRMVAFTLFAPIFAVVTAPSARCPSRMFPSAILTEVAALSAIFSVVVAPSARRAVVTDPALNVVVTYDLTACSVTKALLELPARAESSLTS